MVIQTLIFDQFYHQENYYQLTVKARYGIHNFNIQNIQCKDYFLGAKRYRTWGNKKNIPMPAADFLTQRPAAGGGFQLIEAAVVELVNAAVPLADLLAGGGRVLGGRSCLHPQN